MANAQKKSRVQSSVGGKQLFIKAYYVGQDTARTPDHYVSREDAYDMKARGLASPIHRGTAILIKGPIKLREPHREGRKSRWAVIGQTPKNGTAPGMPHWGLS